MQLLHRQGTIVVNGEPITYLRCELTEAREAELRTVCHTANQQLVWGFPSSIFLVKMVTRGEVLRPAIDIRQVCFLSVLCVWCSDLSGSNGSPRLCECAPYCEPRACGLYDLRCCHELSFRPSCHPPARHALNPVEADTG